MQRAWLVLLLAPVLASCSSMRGLRHAPIDQGEARVFPHEFARVLAAARGAVVDAGLRVTDDEAIVEGWLIGATSTPAATSPMALAQVAAFGVDGHPAGQGDVVRLIIRQRGDSLTTVRILAKARSKPNFAAQDHWSSRVYQRLQAMLDQSAPALTDSAFASWRWAALQAIEHGTIVRILRHDSVFTGAIVRVDSGIVVLEGGHAIRAALIDSVWIRRRDRAAMAGGAVLGAFAGVAAAAALGPECREPDGCFGEAATALVVGAAGGAAIGTAVGSTVTHWRRYFP